MEHNNHDDDNERMMMEEEEEEEGVEEEESETDHLPLPLPAINFDKMDGHYLKSPKKKERDPWVADDDEDR